MGVYPNKHQVDKEIDKSVELLAKKIRVSNVEIIEAATNYECVNKSTPSGEAFKAGVAWLYYLIIDRVGRHYFSNSSYKLGQLTLDDAINHCDDMMSIMESDDVKKEHQQLKQWLIELKNRRDQDSLSLRESKACSTLYKADTPY